MKNQKKTLVAILLLAILTMLMTFPTIFKLQSGMPDLRDSIFDAWVLSWNIQKLISLEFQDYFDANIFFPYKRTLAFSAHYFTQSLIALPIFIITKNPVLTYNFILIFSFFTSALGMFLLARYLTRSNLAGIIAGIIFAFSPFMISHFSHLQILTAGGIPLAFLFLHKYFKHEKTKHLLLFTLFFILQFLAGGYLSMYLTLFCGIYMVVYMVTEKKYQQKQFWIKMGFILLIGILTLGPFMFQYFQIQKEMGFSRMGATGASLTQFLASNPGNWIYGKLTNSNQQVEGILFPGILAIAIAIIGFSIGIKKQNQGKKIYENHILVYSIILASSFLFCFGMKGPYFLLYKIVPGFNALRVAQRFHIMVMFSLAILAAFGIRFLLSGIKKNKKYLIFLLISAGIVLEYLSIPIPFSNLPRKDTFPAVYQWLETIDKDASIIELPIPKNRFERTRMESMRLYYSMFHRKKMVNGRSSYFPPLYYEIRTRWHDSTESQFIADLNILGVDYMILHSPLIKKEKQDRIHQLSRQQKNLQFIKKIGDAWVYKLIPSDDINPDIKRPIFRVNSIGRRGWTAHSNVNPEKAALALDGNRSTAWQTGPQKKGYYFLIDLSRNHLITGLRFRLSEMSPCSYPIGYLVQVSEDQREWKTVARVERTRIPIKVFLQPRKISYDIYFDHSQARYIKIINTGKHRNQSWSISELDVLEQKQSNHTR
jgi:hypothetical protein